MRIVPLQISSEYYDMPMDSLVSDLEAEIGFTFPEDYRSFLIESNGGKPEGDCVFYARDFEQGTLLHILLGMFPQHNWADLGYLWREFNDELPALSIVIGEDQGGNFVVLVADPDWRGVYFWDHKCCYPQTSDEKNLYFIADTFSAFIGSLKTSQ